MDLSDNEREINDLTDLSFGEYIRLIDNHDQWKRLQINLDRTIVVEQLHDVRKIRNDVMHFRPDGTAPEDIMLLKETATFLQQAI